MQDQRVLYGCRFLGRIPGALLKLTDAYNGINTFSPAHADCFEDLGNIQRPILSRSITWVWPKKEVSNEHVNCFEKVVTFCLSESYLSR